MPRFVRSSRLAFLHVCIPALVVFFLLPRNVHAQAVDSVGVRAQGMGGAFTAIADDATATWWNPAGLASGAMLNLSVEYGQLEDPTHERGGFAVTIPSLGFSYYRMPVSEIQPTTSTTAESGAGRQDPGAVTIRTVDLSQFGVTVGQSVGGHLVLASTFKIIHIEDGTSVAVDIGALAVAGHARIGISARNLREPTLGEGDAAFTLTRQVRVGAAVSPLSSAKLAATLAFDADILEVPSATGNERRLAGGGELWIWNHIVGIRAGYGGSTVGESRTSHSFGGSVMVHRGLFIEGQITDGSDVTRKGWGAAFRVTF
jgi:hypothetical protein